MQTTDPKQIDVARRILSELAAMAEHASLTRSLSGGEKAAARSFNSVLQILRTGGLVPEGMFEPIDPEASGYGPLAVQARLLLAVLPEEGEKSKGRREGKEGLGALVALAPFLSSEDLAQMVRERIDDATEVTDGLLTALAPFLDGNHLGELVRRRTRPQAPPTPPTPPKPPVAPASAVTVPSAPDLTPTFRDDQQDDLETLVAELRRPDLTPEDRQRIATRLAELAYEQSVQTLE